MMSPFSACTWAMAPRSRMIQNISYICQETAGCPTSGSQSRAQRAGASVAGRRLRYLRIAALKSVLVGHKNQERVHTLRKENQTCIYCPS